MSALALYDTIIPQTTMKVNAIMNQPNQPPRNIYELIGKIKGLSSLQLEKVALGVKQQMLIHILVSYVNDGAVSAEVFATGLHTGMTATNGMARNNPAVSKLVADIKTLGSPRYKSTNLGIKQQVLTNMLLSHINNAMLTLEVYNVGFKGFSDELLVSIDKKA